MPITIGSRVTYTSYGTQKSARVIRVSADGKILFLDNGRWIHRESVTED
jgi:hypothetical protein